MITTIKIVENGWLIEVRPSWDAIPERTIFYVATSTSNMLEVLRLVFTKEMEGR